MQLLHTQRNIKLPGHINYFGIQGRVDFTDRLKAELMKLAVTSGLRPFVAVAGRDIVQFDRGGKLGMPCSR